MKLRKEKDNRVEYDNLYNALRYLLMEPDRPGRNIILAISEITYFVLKNGMTVPEDIKEKMDKLL